MILKSTEAAVRIFPAVFAAGQVAPPAAEESVGAVAGGPEERVAGSQGGPEELAVVAGVGPAASAAGQVFESAAPEEPAAPLAQESDPMRADSANAVAGRLPAFPAAPAWGLQSAVDPGVLDADKPVRDSENAGFAGSEDSQAESGLDSVLCLEEESARAAPGRSKEFRAPLFSE